MTGQLRVRTARPGRTTDKGPYPPGSDVASGHETQAGGHATFESGRDERDRDCKVDTQRSQRPEFGHRGGLVGLGAQSVRPDPGKAGCLAVPMEERGDHVRGQGPSGQTNGGAVS